MDAALRAMLTDTIQVAPVLGRDPYGAVQYGPATTRPGRLQERMVTQWLATGRAVVPETKLYLDGTPPLDGTEQITLADGRTLPVQGFEVYQDEFGAVSYYCIFF